jgi:hypothetical protein
MPALPVVPNVVRWDLFFSIGADIRALCRMHIGYTGSAPNSASCTAFAVSLDTIADAELAVYMNSANAVTGCRVTDLSSLTGGQGESLTTTAGSLTDEPLSAATAVLASMTIGRRYRGGKPRTYLPLGDAGTVSTPQTWDPTFITNVQASLDAIRTDIGTLVQSGCTLTDLVNVSYYSGFTVVTSPTTGRARNVPTLRVTPVVNQALSWSAEARFASQRRRNLRQP